MQERCSRYMIPFLGLLLAIPLLLTGNSIGFGGDDDLGPPPPPNTQGPRIRFEENNFDWGEVLQGATIDHTYRFRNVGDSVLRITQVKPG